MGPSVSFPLPLRIAKSYRFVIPGKLIIKKLLIPLPIFYYFELIREVLANTGYKIPDVYTNTPLANPLVFTMHLVFTLSIEVVFLPREVHSKE